MSYLLVCDGLYCVSITINISAAAYLASSPCPRVPSELHGSQVAAGEHCSQHALRQTLGLLHRAATAGPVGLPGVTLVAVTTTFESSCRRTDST